MTLDVDRLRHVESIPDDRPGVIDVFAYTLETPASQLEIREGAGLVELSAQEVLATDFPYHYGDTIHAFVTHDAASD